MSTTSTGIPITECAMCGRHHPASRAHCPVCGLAHLFRSTREGAGVSGRETGARETYLRQDEALDLGIAIDPRYRAIANPAACDVIGTPEFWTYRPREDRR